MRLIKKILFPVFSLFLINRSFALVKQLMSSDPDIFTVSQLLFISFLLVLYITGIFAFPGFAYPTNRIRPESYYKLRNPERLEQVYKLLGVRYFNVFLLLVFWGRKNNRRKYFNGTRSGLQNFIYQTKQSEFGHLNAFLVICMVFVLLLIKGYFLLVLFTFLINVLGNLYAIILQRHHRIRIERIAGR